MWTYDSYLKTLNEVEKKNAPRALFTVGDTGLLTDGRRVSIVGSRKATAKGLARTIALAKALVEHNLVIVSGLAAGIDTEAHETAIRCGGKTIAVLGTPINVAFPSSNRALLEKIKSEHLAISQFPVGSKVFPSNFPARNKTMALISDATFIVEAEEDSGTRHQGWEALRLGRMVFLLESLVLRSDLTWPKQMLDYGAQVVSKNNLEDIIYDIPSYTATLDGIFS